MTTATQEAPAQDKSWLEKQREIHGPDVVPPDETLAAPASGETLLESAAQLFGVGVHDFSAAGRTFRVDEPTLRQIKKHLLPAAGKFAGMAKDQTDMEVLMGMVQNTDEFQRLMLEECVVFTDGKPAPENLVDWSDNMKATDALRLVNAFADGINWRDLVEQAKQLAGKIRGTGAGVPAGK